ARAHGFIKYLMIESMEAHIENVWTGSTRKGWLWLTALSESPELEYETSLPVLTPSMTWIRCFGPFALTCSKSQFRAWPSWIRPFWLFPEPLMSIDFASAYALIDFSSTARIIRKVALGNFCTSISDSSPSSNFNPSG